MKGLLALSGDHDPDAAATLFLQSAALARKQGALAWELRAASKNGDSCEPPNSLHQSLDDRSNAKEARCNIDLDAQSDASSHTHREALGPRRRSP